MENEMTLRLVEEDLDFAFGSLNKEPFSVFSDL